MPKFNVPTEDKFIKKVTIAVGLLLFIIIIGTFSIYNSTNSYSDAFLETIELITHVEVRHMEFKFFSIILSIVGYVIQFYLLYVILEFTIEGKLRNLFSEVKMLKNINKLKNHYIICGGGRVGQHVADELVKADKPYVILEADEQRFKSLQKKHYKVLHIDVLDEKEFEKANIKNAAWLLACLGDDGDNILIVLTTRELNPNIRIAARANHERIIPKLTHAGAIHIVCPEALGGAKLAEAAINDKTSPNPVHNEKGHDSYGIDVNS